MPRKDVVVTIGATIEGRWVQGKTTTDWLREPDRLVCDCMQPLGATTTLAGRFKLNDTRPWVQDEVLTAEDVDRIRPTKWIIQAKDGTSYTVSRLTTDDVHWSTQYGRELKKPTKRERGNWYDTEQLEGPDPPYHSEIRLTLKSKKTAKDKKRPREVIDPPVRSGAEIGTTDTQSEPGAKEKHDQGTQERRQRDDMDSATLEGTQDSDSDGEMPELPEEFPDVQAPMARGVLASWDQDGTVITDIVTDEDECPPSNKEDDPEAVAQIAGMREPTEADGESDFGLCTLDGLLRWLIDVEYECRVGIHPR
jgi:hypothetical protein